MEVLSEEGFFLSYLGLSRAESIVEMSARDL